MSDDFATCSCCGVFEPDSKSPEECKKEIINSVEEFCNKDNVDFTTEKLQEFMDEYSEICLREIRGEYFCKACNSWNVFIWQHINYSELREEKTYGKK